MFTDLDKFYLDKLFFLFVVVIRKLEQMKGDLTRPISRVKYHTWRPKRFQSTSVLSGFIVLRKQRRARCLFIFYIDAKTVITCKLGS